MARINVRIPFQKGVTNRQPDASILSRSLKLYQSKGWKVAGWKQSPKAMGKGYELLILEK